MVPADPACRTFAPPCTAGFQTLLKAQAGRADQTRVDASARCAPLLALTALIALAVLGASACSFTGSGSTDHVRAIRITERDFSIVAPRRVRAGELRLVLHNSGPDAHELLIVREDEARPPIRPDGLTVDEAALQPQMVGVFEPGQPGSTREMRLHLSPGRYELFCNMAGHFMGGMHTILTVLP